jgi:putative endonuclease
VLEHKTKIIKNSFSNKYKLYKLIWFEEFSSPEEAIIVEKKIKDMRREKKIRLIRELNPTFKDLFALC